MVAPSIPRPKEIDSAHVGCKIAGGDKAREGEVGWGSSDSPLMGEVPDEQPRRPHQQQRHRL